MGISEDLNERKVKQHLEAGETGWSSFRRSIGAILKSDLKLTAVKRDKEGKKLRPANYKFTDEGESLLTDWILSNTGFAYWASGKKMTKKELEDIETQVIKIMKPTLDLHKKTKHLNPMADELTKLRKVCNKEVRTASRDTLN